MNDKMIKMMELQNQERQLLDTLKPGTYDPSAPEGLDKLNEIRRQLKVMEYNARSVNEAADIRGRIASEPPMNAKMAEHRFRQAQNEFKNYRSLRSQLPVDNSFQASMGSDSHLPKIKEGLNSEIVDAPLKKGQAYIDSLKDQGFKLEQKRNYRALTEKGSPHLERYNLTKPSENIKIRGSGTIADAGANLAIMALIEGAREALSVHPLGEGSDITPYSDKELRKKLMMNSVSN